MSVSSSVRPLLLVFPNRNFKIQRGAFMCNVPANGTPTLLKHLDTNTHLTVRSKNQNQITKWRFLPPSGRPVWKEEKKLQWSRKWKDVGETARNWFKIAYSIMHNSQSWIWPNQRECLFFEKTVISTSFFIIHYGLIFQNKTHAAILGQDCPAFLSWGIRIVYVTIS